MLSTFSISTRFTKVIMLGAFLLGLQACGGDSDKKPTNSSSSVSSVSSTVSSAGTSSSTESSASSSSSATVTTNLSGIVSLQNVDGEAEPIIDAESVEIRLSLIDESQVVLDETTASLISVDLSDAQSLPFSAALGADEARYVVVHISKPGYTDYARRFDVQADITITATLSELPVGDIQATSVQTISGEAVTGFNFSVVTTVDGQQIQQGSGDTIPELSVSISEAALPEGTESIAVQMQAFNPNDVEDAAYFPGAYEDSEGNALLSVAFNYTDVTTDSGVSLQKLAVKTRQKRLAAEKRGINFQKLALESEPVIINRTIPAESCLSLTQLGDSDTEMTGFQVPVYTYNPTSGVWDLLGHGTLYSEEGILIESTFSDFDCEQFTYVLEIRVTNEIFISNWWNLDYPLVFEEPVKLCATLALKNEQGLPAVGSILFVNDDDDARSFSAETYVTDENGIANIEVYSLGNDLDTSANLTIYTQNYLQRIQKTFELSTSCSNVTPIEIPVELPAACKVEGKLFTPTGAPLIDTYVYAWGLEEGEGDNMWTTSAYGQTDVNGRYAFNVSCNLNYSIVEYYSLFMNDVDDTETIKTFNVNEQLTADEKTDNGRAVVMNDLEVNHNKPFAYVANSDESLSTVDVIFYYAGENYPLQYEFDIVDSENVTVKHITGEITAEDVDQGADGEGFIFDTGMVVLNHNISVPDAFAVYSITGTVTDAENNEGRISGAVYLGEIE